MIEAAEARPEVTIVLFDGGRYAVTRCSGVEAIPSTWQELVNWVANSSHQPVSPQWLEEHLRPVDSVPEAWISDLYAPIAD